MTDIREQLQYRQKDRIVNFVGQYKASKIMDGLDNFMLFNACEDAREWNDRENNTDNYNSLDSSWNSGSSDDKDE